MKHIIIIIMFFSLSCNRNERTIEKKLVKNFEIQENKLDSIIKLVNRKYLIDSTFKQLNRLQFTTYKGKLYGTGSILVDSFIANMLENAGIINVSFEKSSNCLNIYSFDLVKYKILVDDSKYEYNYVYDYCPSKKENISLRGFKSIYIKGNWFLEVEK